MNSDARRKINRLLELCIRKETLVSQLIIGLRTSIDLSGYPEISKWATNESVGYKDEEDLPEYRNVFAQIQVDVTQGLEHLVGRALHPHEIPDYARDKISDEFKLFQSVSQLEELAKHASSEIKMAIFSGDALAALINFETKGRIGRVDRVYNSLSITQLNVTLDAIRVQLIEYLIAMGGKTKVPSYKTMRGLPSGLISFREWTGWAAGIVATVLAILVWYLGS